LRSCVNGAESSDLYDPEPGSVTEINTQKNRPKEEFKSKYRFSLEQSYGDANDFTVVDGIPKCPTVQEEHDVRKARDGAIVATVRGLTEPRAPKKKRNRKKEFCWTARNKGQVPKRKRDDDDEEEEERYFDAHTGLTDDEEDYFSAIEDQPAIWPILRRRGVARRGRKRVMILA
jgi:hypothetical protein